MVNKSERLCFLEETSDDGAAGSSATEMAPGVPGTLAMFTGLQMIWHSTLDAMLLISIRFWKFSN